MVEVVVCGTGGHGLSDVMLSLAEPNNGVHQRDEAGDQEQGRVGGAVLAGGGQSQNPGCGTQSNACRAGRWGGGVRGPGGAVIGVSGFA